MDAAKLQQFLMWLEDTYGPEEILELPGASINHLSARITEWETLGT
jgi:hypothetical protein